MFSPQEGVADGAAAPPKLLRRGQEGEYNDELRLDLLRESQRRIEQEQAWARVQVEPFVPTLSRGSVPGSSCLSVLVYVLLCIGEGDDVAGHAVIALPLCCMNVDKGVCIFDFQWNIVV